MENPPERVDFSWLMSYYNYKYFNYKDNMFRRENSKTLKVLNIFLLIQIISGAINFFSAVANTLFPIWYTPGPMAWIGPLFIMLIAAAIAFLVNAPLRDELFDVRLPFSEKLFALICLQTINGLLCGAFAIILNAMLGPSSVVTWPVLTLFTCTCIFALGIVVAKKAKLFSIYFSGLANAGGLIFTISILDCLSWAVGASFLLANIRVNSVAEENAIKQQIFVSICMAILFTVILITVNKFAMKGAESRKELQRRAMAQYERTGYAAGSDSIQPAVPQQETQSHDDKESYAEEQNNENYGDKLQSMQDEIARLKEQLNEKEQSENNDHQNEE